MVHKQRRAGAAGSLSAVQDSLTARPKVLPCSAKEDQLFENKQEVCFGIFTFQIRLFCLSDYSALYSQGNRRTDRNHDGTSSLTRAPLLHRIGNYNLNSPSKGLSRTLCTTAWALRVVSCQSALIDSLIVCQCR